MKSLFGGQKTWLWYQLDAETRERVFHALNENGAPVQEGDWMQGAHSKEEFLVVDDVQKVLANSSFFLGCCDTEGA